MATVINGVTYEAGIGLDAALDRVRRTGIGVLEAQRLQDGRLSSVQVQSASDPTGQHAVGVQWLADEADGTVALLRCDCPAAWRLCCMHRASVVALVMCEAGMHGKYDVRTATCPCCSATYFEARRDEPDTRAEQRWLPNPFAPARSSREIRLALAPPPYVPPATLTVAQMRANAHEALAARLANENASQDAQDGQGDVSPSAGTVDTSEAGRPRWRPYSERQRDMRPVEVDWAELEALAARRESSPIARPVLTGSVLFK